MVQRQKIVLLGTMGVVVLALVVLAGGISQLELASGKLSDVAQRAELQSLIAGQLRTLRDLVIVLLILSPLALFLLPRTKARKPEKKVSKLNSKSVLVMVIQAVMWAIALIIIRRRLAEGGLDLLPQTTTEGGELLPGDLIQAPALQIPEWLSYVFSLGVLLILVLVLWTIWYRRRPIKNPLGMVAQEAQFALEELESGGDFRNVIMRCYHDMVRALSYRRGIRRREAMTAREFEQRLVELGLPAEPVGQLTHLFELVRYGAKEPGAQAERQAVKCLDEIVKASGEIS